MTFIGATSSYAGNGMIMISQTRKTDHSNISVLLQFSVGGILWAFLPFNDDTATHRNHMMQGVVIVHSVLIVYLGNALLSFFFSTAQALRCSSFDEGPSCLDGV